jgi:chaperonin GroES
MSASVMMPSETSSGAPAAPAAAGAMAGLLNGTVPAAQLPDNGDMKVINGEQVATPDMAAMDQLKVWIEAVNIADDLGEDECARIAVQVIRDYHMDEETRAEWFDKYNKWLKFAMQMTEAKTYPWPGASNVIYPMITTASIQFAARAYPAIIMDKDVVKGTIQGPDDGVPMVDPRTGQPAMQQGPDGQPAPVWKIPPGIKKQRADRIGQHMSWQLLEEQEEWEPQTDAMLLILPIVGCMFRKTYFDPGSGRNVSETVTAADLCIDYKAKSFERAPRVSEIVRLYPYEIEEKIRAGIFLENEYGMDTDAGQDDDAICTFIEQHRRWDLDDDGYPEPYIITVARDSGKMARIKAAYDFDGVMIGKRDGEIKKIEAIAYYTKFGFIPAPDGGVYDIGFGHLLFPINEAVNSTLNQLFDAGHLANAGGGFIGSGLSMNTGAVRFQIGEYKPVNTNGGTIRDNVFPIPFAGPNPVLFSLLQFLVEAGKEVAAVKDVMVGDLPGDNTSGVATLAMIEQGLSVFSAIYKRIHRSLKLEFKKLFRLNRLYLPVESGYLRGTEWRQITQADYEAGAGVQPVSDPKMVTDMQKLGRAQFLMQFKDDPWFKAREIRLAMLDAALFADAENMLVQQPAPNPEMGAQVAQMQLEKEALDLKHLELNIRQANEQAERENSRRKTETEGIRSLAQAINQLSQAAKNDHEVNQAWYAAHLKTLQLQMDALNAAADAGAGPANNAAGASAGGVGQPLGASVAAHAGGPNVGPMGAGSGAGVGGATGADGAGMAGVATPSSQPGVSAVSFGLPAQQ